MPRKIDRQSRWTRDARVYTRVIGGIVRDRGKKKREKKKRKKEKKKKGKKSGQFWKNEFSSACFRAVLPAIRTACFFTPCRKVELIELTRLLRRVCAFGTANIFLINAVCYVYYIDVEILLHIVIAERLVPSFLPDRKRKNIYIYISI